MRDIEKYAESYMVESFEPVMARFRKRKILEFLKRNKPRKILEIGCGTESIANFYDDYDLFHIVEPAAKFTGIAKNSAFFNRRVLISENFLENIPPEDFAEFDFIIASGLLHEVSEPEFLLAAIRRLCHPGTLLHINVPNAESFHLAWAFKAGLIPELGVKTERFNLLQQTTVFSLHSLEELVEKAGFRTEEIGSYFIKPFNHEKMQKAVECGLINDELLDGLYMLTEFFPSAGAEIFVNCRVRS